MLKRALFFFAALFYGWATWAWWSHWFPRLYDGTASGFYLASLFGVLFTIAATYSFWRVVRPQFPSAR